MSTDQLKIARQGKWLFLAGTLLFIATEVWLSKWLQWSVQILIVGWLMQNKAVSAFMSTDIRETFQSNLKS